MAEWLDGWMALMALVDDDADGRQYSISLKKGVARFETVPRLFKKYVKNFGGK